MAAGSQELRTQDRQVMRNQLQVRYRNIPAVDIARLFLPPENDGKSGVPLNSLRFAAYNNAVKAIWRMCVATGQGQRD